MFVTHKNSKVTGYTKVSKYGETIGGGWFDTPAGGGFYNGPCGEPCLFDAGKRPQDKRQTLAKDYAFSDGFCTFSRSESCNIGGYCGLGAGTNAGANLESPYASYTSSAKIFAKQTCLEGLTSTQGDSENPYTKTAELACTTSENSGKDVPFLGALGTTTKDCYYVTPAGALSLYAGGPNFPAVLDSAKTASWCGARNFPPPDGDGECQATATCSGCVIDVQTFYDLCGKPDANPDYPAVMPAYKTVDKVCPIYYEPECESAYILSKAGNYITAGSKNIGPFATVTVYALSTDKAVEFSMSSGKESPKIDQTFSYSNSEVKYTGLKGKESTYTNSYIWLGESGASTTTYKVGAGGYEAGTDPFTLFYSGEVKATAKGAIWETIGPGSNPCCDGSQCTSEEVSKETTDTLLAGSSFEFTHSKISTTQLGDYVAYQATSIIRKDHLAWGEFGYSTTAGGSYNSNREQVDKYECPSFSSPIVGGTPGYACFKCLGGNVPREVAVAGPPESAACGLNCGCTSTTGETTVPGPNTLGKTQCYDPCTSVEECTQVYPGLSGFGSGIGCCPTNNPEYGDPVWNTEKDEIQRKGDCAVVNKMSLSVAYTHLTRAQTLTTEIAFQDGGFQATLQKSEGLYFLDSNGSMQTATSFSLKQSKSDITNSHVGFAFSGVYYNPMGRTTQFGSDGAKKTFIALATGDAVYLVGSPDGKSKGTATASHDGDVHSYYISDPDAKKIWNQASWPGHGVVNGKITTGTFSFSFNTGAFKNSYGGNGSLARFSPGAKQTIVAHGGLNLIFSKANVSEKSFKTTYSTKAFSTSFDSTFKGAWIAKAIPYTYVATKSVGLSPNPNPYAGIETNHVFSLNCPGCDFPQPGIPIPLIADTSTHFIRGNKSLLYNNNATSYLWTHPAFKKKWGDGHGAECE